MRRLFTLIAVVLCLTWIASCAGPQSCECGGTCEECTAADATACEGCVALQAGQTGWCEACGAGYFEGQEVNCKGECAANPGGPPCADCVKQ